MSLSGSWPLLTVRYDEEEPDGDDAGQDTLEDASGGNNISVVWRVQDYCMYVKLGTHKIHLEYVLACLYSKKPGILCLPPP